MVRQPFIEGRLATYSEAVGANETVHAAGLQMIVDVSYPNVIVTSDNRRKIIDFALDFAFHDQLRAQYGISFGDAVAADESKG